MRHVAMCVFLAVALALSGCAGFRDFLQSRKAGPKESYTSEEFPPQFASVIADDISERLVAGYPPGQTSLFLYISGEGAVAQAVEDTLRAKGFHIIQERDPDSLTLTWCLDRLDQDGWFLVVDLSSGYRFTRLYSSAGVRLEPVGLLSQGIF